VPGGAVRISDGDEVGPSDGTYLMHPHVGLVEAIAAGGAMELKGL
jgi:hypothetical protein